MKISRKLFLQNNLKATFEHASLFDMPFESNKFDLVWNSGVIEHFDKNMQVRALQEMSRVCKIDGIMIILVPCSRAIFYRLGKWFEEKNDRWKWGVETPLSSFNVLSKLSGIKIEKEFSVGFCEQMRFMYNFPFVGKIFFRLEELIKSKFWKLNYLPGYLLVGIFKK